MLIWAKSKGIRTGRAPSGRWRGAPAIVCIMLSVAWPSIALAKPTNVADIPLLGDTTAPSTPLVVVTDLGPTHVSLAWSATDDGPFLWYSVYMDSVAIFPLIGSASATAFLLTPGTTYTFTVQARDIGGNESGLSAPVTVTTPDLGFVDTQPPTIPTGLVTDVFDNEISLRWLAATDDHDEESMISYEIFLDGELVDVAVGGRLTSVVYGVNGLNLISVVAVDTSGNASAPISLLVDVAF